MLLQQADVSPSMTQVFDDIIKKSTGDIILFVGLMLIGLVLIMLPIIRMSTKAKKDERLANAEERKELIDVINRNTSAFTQLNTVIGLNNESITRALSDIAKQHTTIESLLTSIETRQNAISDRTDLIHRDVVLIDTKIDALSDDKK